MIRERSIQALVLAQLISALGSQMTFVALPWFVLVTTGSPERMALVFAVEVLPMALFGIPSGSVVQRFGARATMLAADLAAAPLVALVPLLHSAGELSFPLLLAIVFALGLVTTPYFSSTRVLLPELVGEDNRAVAQANTLLEGSTQLMGLAGPALAGVLIAAVGATNVLLLDAASFATSFLLLALFVPRRRPLPSADEDQRGVLAGLRFIVRDRLLRGVMGVSLLFGTFVPFLFAALPVLAYERYGGQPEIAGWLFAAWGGGSVAGSVFAYRAASRVDPLRLGRFACWLCVAPLWLLVLDLPPLGAVSVIFASSFFVPALNAPVLGLFALRPPPPLRAKTMTGLITTNAVARPVSYALAGPLLTGLGLRATFLVLAAGLTGAAALFGLVAREQAPVERDPGQTPAAS